MSDAMLVLAERLMDDSGNKTTQLGLAIVNIVGALKEQPNFDVADFEAKMLKRAGDFSGKDEWLVRLLLETVGGKELPKD